MTELANKVDFLQSKYDEIASDHYGKQVKQFKSENEYLRKKLRELERERKNEQLEFKSTLKERDAWDAIIRLEFREILEQTNRD